MGRRPARTRPRSRCILSAGRTISARCKYLQQAAANALRRFAYQEVVSHLTHGLELLASLPETAAHLHQELDLQVALGAALMATQGYASPDVERTHARARELCQQLGDTAHLFQALRGLSLHYLTRGLLHTASDLGSLLLRQAQTQPDPAPRLLAHHQMGMVLGFRGEPAQARTHHTQALALYRSQEDYALAGSYGVDLGVLSHCWLAWEQWLLGFPDQAVQEGQVSRTLAKEAAHPWCLWMTLFWSAAPASVAPRDAGRLRADHSRDDAGDRAGICAVVGVGHAPAGLDPGPARPG